MTAVQIRTMADVPAAAAAMLGFTPTESLVVLGLGGGPAARVDLIDGFTEVMSFEPVSRYWSRVVIVVFSATPQAAAIRDVFRGFFPLVEVYDALDVRDGYVTSASLGTTERVAEIAPGILGDRIVADSRESVVAEAEEVTDPAEALRLAEGYYARGDGARAWVYADRARALGADPSPIEAHLMNGDNPKEVL